MSNRTIKLTNIMMLLEQARHELEDLVEESAPNRMETLFEEMCVACDITLEACNAVERLMPKQATVDGSLLN